MSEQSSSGPGAKPGHGGRRKGAGRPRLGPDLVSITVQVTSRQRAWLDRQEGSLAQAVRRLLDRAMLSHPPSDS